MFIFHVNINASLILSGLAIVISIISLAWNIVSYFDKKGTIKIDITFFIDNLTVSIINTTEKVKTIQCLCFKMKGNVHSFDFTEHLAIPFVLHPEENLSRRMHESIITNAKDRPYPQLTIKTFWKIIPRILRGCKLQAIIQDTTGKIYKSKWIRVKMLEFKTSTNNNFLDGLNGK